MPKLNISQDGVKKSEKRNIDFVSGDNIDITITDGDADDAVQIRVDGSAGGPGGSVAVQEEGVEVVATASALNFDGDDFNITDAGSGVATIDVDATHAGSTHSAATDTHIADAAGAHAATAISADSTTIAGSATDVQGVLEDLDDGIAGLRTPDYLVGTTNAGLSAEIVVGTTPGGELGNTWASPTVDATHSGSSHAGVVTAHEGAADPHTGYLKESDFDDVDFLVGTATGHTAAEIVVGTSPGGELGGTWASPTVDATHSGSAHLVFDDAGAPAAVSTAAADGTASEPSRKDHVHPHETAHLAHDTLWAAANDYVRGTGNDTAAVQTASAATPAAVSTSGSTGTAANPPSADDHVHAHEAAHINHDTTWAAKGDLISGTANDTAAVTTVGANDTILMADSGAGGGIKWVAAATAATVGTANAEGTADTFTRGDHVHAHEAAHINHDTTWAAKGDIITATANDTAAVTTVGADDTILMADASAGGGVKWAAAATTTEIADIADSEAAGTSDTYARGDHVHSGAAYRKESDIRHLCTFSKEGNLGTGTGTIRWYNDTGVTITMDSARGSVGTAPATQSILIDVNINGTSAWASTQANRITIAAASNTDEGGAFDDATVADGEYLTVDIDQVGTGTVGADLSVSIWGHNA